MGASHRLHQNWIVNEGLSPFKIKFMNLTGVQCLLKHIFQLDQRKYPRLARAAPDKTVITFVVTLVCQQNMEAVEFHNDRL